MEPHSIVVVSLQSPKEKLWGELIDISNAGVSVRGIDLHSFDDFVSQVLHPDGDRTCFESNASRSTNRGAQFHRSQKCLRRRPAVRSRSIWHNSPDRKNSFQLAG
jgi:hypothetical protein